MSLGTCKSPLGARRGRCTIDAAQLRTLRELVARMRESGATDRQILHEFRRQRVFCRREFHVALKNALAPIILHQARKTADEMHTLIYEVVRRELAV